MLFEPKYQETNEKGDFITIRRTEPYGCREVLVNNYREMMDITKHTDPNKRWRVIVCSNLKNISPEAFERVKYFIRSIGKNRANKYRRASLERIDGFACITFNFRPTGCLTSFLAYILRYYTELEDGDTIENVVDLIMRKNSPQTIPLAVYGTKLFGYGLFSRGFFPRWMNGPASCVANNIRQFQHAFERASRNKTFAKKARKLNVNSDIYMAYWPVGVIAKCYSMENTEEGW